jgi:tRNA pseudouridine38-40 synthase
VHALAQVIHFDTEVSRSDHSWLMGANSHLPDTIRGLWVKPVPGDFHARYSAVARSYRYIILNRPMKSALLRRQVTWCRYPLDVARMQQASQCLIGNHDFSSFRAKECQSNSPWRFLHLIRIDRQADQVVVELAANAFLHHMVRNIVGLLMDIGAGKQPPEWAEAVLLARDRRQGGVTAPADGLYLSGVLYPEAFAMPRAPVFDLLPSGIQRYQP